MIRLQKRNLSIECFYPCGHKYEIDKSFLKVANLLRRKLSAVIIFQQIFIKIIHTRIL